MPGFPLADTPEAGYMPESVLSYVQRCIQSCQELQSGKGKAGHGCGQKDFRIWRISQRVQADIYADGQYCEPASLMPILMQFGTTSFLISVIVVRDVSKPDLQMYLATAAIVFQ